MMRLARFYGVMVAISGLALGAMGQAAAASVTHTMDINTLTQPGFIPQFNPDLGTLLEVDFSATGSASAIIHVDPPVYAAVIPEPPSAVMAGIASLAGLGYWLRRRKRVYGEHASEIVSQCTNVVYFRQADVESANQGTEVDTTTASGKFVFGIFAALAEFERELSWNESKRAWKRPAPAVGKAGGSFP